MLSDGVILGQRKTLERRLLCVINLKKKEKHIVATACKHDNIA